MSRPTSNTVNVTILEKDYLVACPPEARFQLEESARYLDSKMREIRSSGKVVGTERIAVMAALNMAYELLQGNAQHRAVEEQLKRLQERLDQILTAPTSQNE